MFILKFFQTVILEQLRNYLAKIAHKVEKSKYFSNIQNESYSQLNSLSSDIWFDGVKFDVQKLFRGGGGGGGGETDPPRPFIL